MTIKIEYAQNERYLQWAAEKIGIDKFRDDARTITLIRDYKIAAVSVYDTFSTNDCQMHIASDGSKRWATREYRHEVFAFPFIQCKLNRTTTLVSINNHLSQKFCEQLGYTQEGVLREAGNENEDMIVYGMLAYECRFITRPLFCL